MVAHTAKEALRNDELKRGGKKRSGDAKLEKPCDRADCVIRVKCREEKPTGKRGSDGDFCGFLIADFSDEDDVGVLSQKRAQTCGKGKTNLRLYL